ncbi:MAG: UvrD-helicase domain-containing protein, partial [Candidatus Kapabacteria bacterium]|nr:UvrD-helicase domain-containing protein [Candidatus Kapabacteria bacterium]
MQSSKIKYTREQTLALLKDRHLAVTANAGSGKTSVLVEKYLDLLLNSTADNPVETIRSIVAITFTRQAASDMKAKITTKLSEKLLQGTLNAKELRKLKILRENISAARVSTIHSFCNSLLKDYPIEAGISPVFRELDEYESMQFAEMAIDELIEKYSDVNDNDKDSNEIKLRFQELVKYVGINKLRENLLELVKEPVLLANLKNYYNKDTDLLYKEYNNEYESQLLMRIREFDNIFMRNYNQIEGKNIERVVNLNNELQKAMPNLQQCIKYLGEINSVKNPRKNLGYFLIDCEFEADEGLCKRYRNSLKELIDLQMYDKENDLLYLKQIQSLVLFASESEDALKVMKDDYSAYSFDDLLLLTSEMLGNTELRERIVKDLSYLMVDEFQDTNLIQYSIVRALCPTLDDCNLRTGPKLFIVGDSKQSIYGFRNADVSVFNQAKLDIAGFNKSLLERKIINYRPNLNNFNDNLNEREAVGNISLADTFRLLPAVALFTNKICRTLIGKEEYEDLVCGRKLIEEVKDNSTLSRKNGTISFLVAKKQYSGNLLIDDVEERYEDESHNKCLTEEELLADFIIKIVSGESNIQIFDGEKYVPPKFRDIAILARKKNNLSVLAKEFIKKNINYTIVSGNGFFQTQEVGDFISLLNFLVNSNDDISLAAILKSPMFKISDSELLNIANSSGLSFYDKLINFKPQNEDSIYFIERAKKILHNLIESSSLMQISELIEYTVEITDYYAAIRVYDAKEQMKSNISQLINHARNFESKGYKSLYEYINQLNSSAKVSQESEAAFISGDDTVSLMTCHASKGLEFPVVVLYKSNLKKKNSNDMMKSKNYGISVNLKLPEQYNDEGRLVLKPAKTMVQSLIKDKINEAESAEEARLLYVSLTRAKDHLIITSTVRENKDSYSVNEGSFIAMLLKGLDKKAIDLLGNDIIKLNDKLKFTAQGICNLNLDINIIREIEPLQNFRISESQESDKESPIPRDYFTKRAVPGDYPDIASATKYSLFLNNKDEFISKYVLGLPDLYLAFHKTEDVHDSDITGGIP